MTSTRRGVKNRRRGLTRGRSAPLEALGIEAPGFGVGSPVDQRRQQMEAVRALVADEVEVLELDRAPLLDDGRGRSAHGRDPVGELLGIGHGGGQAHEPHLGREVDDHLLPHRAAVRVLQVVHLVEHHEPQIPQRARAAVDHVAQDLGRHHDDGSVTVDAVVAGEEPDAPGAMPANEIAELLVRQRLDRRRVERLAALRERERDGVLRDDRLARPCRRGDEHRLAVLERRDRPALEVVKLEVVVDAGRAHVACAARRFSTNRPMRIATS